jgi:hypothetical protein
VIGDVDPDGPFVHVLDDSTLDIVLGELDTIVDLSAYLTKKEQLVRSGTLLTAAGEEDLLAYYMTHMNSSGEHDFTKPDGLLRSGNLRQPQDESVVSKEASRQDFVCLGHSYRAVHNAYAGRHLDSSGWRVLIPLGT